MKLMKGGVLAGWVSQRDGFWLAMLFLRMAVVVT